MGGWETAKNDESVAINGESAVPLSPASQVYFLERGTGFCFLKQQVQSISVLPVTADVHRRGWPERGHAKEVS